MAGTFRVDDHETKAMLRHYGPDKLARIFQTSARAGARAIEAVLEPAAPIGRSKRPSQFYRMNSLPHGTFRGTVKARRIRKVGIQRRTIGFVIGPAGPNAFTRSWIAGGTHPHIIRTASGATIPHPGQRANPWLVRAAAPALTAGTAASDVVVVRYLRKIPGV